MRMRFLYCLIVMIATLDLSSAAVAPQTAESVLNDRLERRVHVYAIAAHDFADALTHVARDFQIPMGIEWIPTTSTNTSITLSWKDATVKRIISDIVRTQTGYQILINNSVVHVVLPDVIPRSQDFLSLPISQFSVDRVPVEMVSRRLREIVKAKLSAGTSRKAIAGSQGANPDDPKITLQLNNATVRDVLDQIILASTRKIWVVTFLENPKPTPAGFRRTMTLWNSSPVSDDEQPVWDLLRWTDRLPEIAPGRNGT